MVKKIISFFIFSGLVICESTIAVFDFSNNGLSNNEVLTLTDRLRTELVRVSEQKIVERNKIDDILREQKFQMSGCVDECLIELGKLLGANSVVTGSIGKVGNIFTISARMVNVESGEIIQAISYDSDYQIGNLLKYGMKECAYQLIGKEPPKVRNFNLKRQAYRAGLGYLGYLIILGLLPPS